MGDEDELRARIEAHVASHRAVESFELAPDAAREVQRSDGSQGLEPVRPGLHRPTQSEPEPTEPTEPTGPIAAEQPPDATQSPTRGVWPAPRPSLVQFRVEPPAVEQTPGRLRGLLRRRQVVEPEPALFPPPPWLGVGGTPRAAPVSAFAEAEQTPTRVLPPWPRTVNAEPVDLPAEATAEVSAGPEPEPAPVEADVAEQPEPEPEPAVAKPRPVAPGTDLTRRLAAANAAAMAGARTAPPATPAAPTVDGGDDGDDAKPTGLDWHRIPVRSLTRRVILVAVAVLAALLLRTYVAESYYIPSASMETTLHGCPGCNNEHVLVNKLSYKLHDLRRGDVVVFHRPKAWLVTDKVLIKRVIGLPGDTLTDRKGIVYVNGFVLDEPYIDPACRTGGTTGFPLKPVTVPDGKAFVMGDNRCDSSDSRRYGAISASDVIGRAFVIIWPLGRIHWL